MAGIFSRDNRKKVPVAAITATTDSNNYLRALIPQYAPSESIFAIPGSVYTPSKPDENKSSLNEIIKKGENYWAYVRGLKDTSNPTYPLLADGFSSTVGTYAAADTAQGGQWKGKKAIVIRVDQSGTIENANASFQIFGQTGTGTAANIFVPTASWLTGTTVLNPLLP